MIIAHISVNASKALAFYALAGAVLHAAIGWNPPLMTQAWNLVLKGRDLDLLIGFAITLARSALDPND